MRILTIALGLVLAGNAMAESKGLSDIYNLAVANDPSLRAQIAFNDGYKAMEDSARSKRGPSVSLSASTTQNYSALSNTEDYSDSGSITLSMPIYDRATNKEITEASLKTTAAEFSLNSYRQSHIVGVSEAYFNVLSAQSELEASRAEVEALAKQLEQANERLLVGIGTRVDVDQARAQLDLSRVSLISAELKLESEREDLVGLIGVGNFTLRGLLEGLKATSHRDAVQNLDALIDAHPSVRESSLAYQAAVANLDEARGERWPSLDLSSTYAVTEVREKGSSDDGLSKQGNSVSLTLTVPIFKSGFYDAGIAKAYAEMVEKESELEKVRREVKRDMVIADRELDASIRTVEARKLALTSAESRVEATEAAYAVGSGDIVEVLNAKKDLFLAESNYQKAQHDFLLQQLKYDQAIGDLSEAAIARIDQYLVQ